MTEELQKSLEDLVKAKLLTFEGRNETRMTFHILNLGGLVSEKSGSDSYRIVFKFPTSNYDDVSIHVLREKIDKASDNAYVVSTKLEVTQAMLPVLCTVELVTSDIDKFSADIKDLEWKCFNKQFTQSLEKNLDEEQ